MTRRPYTHSSLAGRLLMALRAGETTLAGLAERFGRTAVEHVAPQLLRAGLIELNHEDRLDKAYRLTPAGRAACPSRRDAVQPQAMRISA